MITTNKTGMPDYIYDWASDKNNEHSLPNFDRVSTTFIFKDPTYCVLFIRHSSEATVDLQDTASQNTGTSNHADVLEYAEKRGAVIEQSLAIGLYDESGDFVLTGQLDAYFATPRILDDLKFSKLATFNKNRNGQDTEWFNQLTTYVYLLDNVNPEWYQGVDTIRNIVNIKDLSKVKELLAGNSADQWRIIYWDKQKVYDNIPTALEKIHENIRKIRALKNVSDEELPICSDEFRYAEKVYKIYKRKSKGSEETNKTAVTGHAKYESMDAALEGFKNAGFTDDTHVIKEVGGESIKCKYYCDMKDYCPHYKKMMEAQNGQTA